jgi:hypothetical protein
MAAPYFLAALKCSQLLVVVLLIFGTLQAVHAAEFFCSPGDVACLIAAINESNKNGEDNTINLDGDYPLKTLDNETAFEGPNGLPSMTGKMVIQANDPWTPAKIFRDVQDGFNPAPNDPSLFRIVYIDSSGVVTLKNLSVLGGLLPFPYGGGGIVNHGSLVLENSTVGGGGVKDSGGGAMINSGILSVTSSRIGGNGAFLGGLANGGNAIIRRSSLTGSAGIGGFTGAGAVSNGGVLTIEDSTIDRSVSYSAAIVNGGQLTIKNTTISRSFATAIENTGFISIQNSTIVGNRPRTDSFGPCAMIGGICNKSGTVELRNTILALNTVPAGEDPRNCNMITSLGSNLFGNLTGCTVALQPDDIISEDPGLGAFVDDGTPGHGYFPLLETSPAIGAGNNGPCPATDQLGLIRLENCDIGAIEFQPVPVMILTVVVDIRPHSPNNKINPNSNAVIRVAILGTSDFDVSAIDQASLRFGPNQIASEGKSHLRDVNHDGLLDLVQRFRVQGSGIQCGDTSVSITGQTVSGQPIVGTDTIRTVGCNAKSGKKK